MINLLNRFDQVFIDENSRSSLLAKRLQSIFPKEKISFVSSQPLAKAKGDLSAQEFDRSKRNLFVTPFKGKFFKRCPGSRPGLACCNYFVLNWGLQCDMNCSYCYLQSFINTSALTIYSNLDQALSELRAMDSMRDSKLRVGTGETVDSLSLDELTLYSHELITFFRDYPNWQLEFKTKSSKVDQFLEVPHAGNVIVSWSINPQEVIENEEHDTASLAERLAAAQKCSDKGFQIAFHIDPIIWHKNWRQNYTQLVKEVTQRFEPSQMPYISVGTLRLQPEQRHMMRERFGMRSWVNQAELFQSKDGKLRYDQSLRDEMYQFVIAQFKKASPDWKLFLCMETPETWLATAGKSPFKEETLATLFDQKVIRAAEVISEQSFV